MLKIIVVLVILIVSISIYWSGREGRRLFKEALALENEGKHEPAIFKYAEAVKEGASKKKCIAKIKGLSSEHGPFDFVRVEEINRDRFDCDSCSFAYHSEITYFIKKTLGKNKAGA